MVIKRTSSANVIAWSQHRIVKLAIATNLRYNNTSDGERAIDRNKTYSVLLTSTTPKRWFMNACDTTQQHGTYAWSESKVTDCVATASILAKGVKDRTRPCSCDLWQVGRPLARESYIDVPPWPSNDRDFALKGRWMSVCGGHELLHNEKHVLRVLKRQRRDMYSVSCRCAIASGIPFQSQGGMAVRAGYIKNS
jgi:hypothetical protein